MIFSKMDSRAQVDLIDMQSQSDGDRKWTLVYQDHLTKFVQLHPVTSKRAPEIAYQLLDIFSIFRAPSILQSDNGKEFVNGLRFIQVELTTRASNGRHTKQCSVNLWKLD